MTWGSCLGLRVEGLGFSGLGLRDLGFRVQGFRVQGALIFWVVEHCVADCLADATVDMQSLAWALGLGLLGFRV